MRRIALVNQKGGVGKTTTAVNLSAAISRLDRRVLLIDLDPQSNATVSLGVAPDQQKNNTSYGLLNGAPFQPIELGPNFHLVPSNIELAGAEMELTSVIGREIVLRDALAEVTGYDFMILDCSPSLGLLSVNALTTAKEVMVPLQCEFLALHGISLLMRTIELVRKRLNTELAITGVIPCMYDVRKGLARDVVVEIEKHFGDKVFRSKIRSNVRLAEAPSHGKSIFDYAPDSYGAEDYLALAREIVGIEMIPRAPLPAAPGLSETTSAPELEIPVPVPELVVAGAIGEPLRGSRELLADPVVVLPSMGMIAPLPSPEPVVVLAPVPEPVATTAPAAPPIVEAPALDTVGPAPDPEPEGPTVSITDTASEPEPSAPSSSAAPAESLPPDPQPAGTTGPSSDVAAGDRPTGPATPDIVSDGVVEFIELIPLEIEDLPFIEPERLA
jgi:chromosome partitioning protein